MGKDLISREALERIIQRAAELQASEHDIGDGLTKDEVLALGKDVGIPNRYLQQRCSKNRPARSSRPGGHGFWAWLTGPRSLAAQRSCQAIGPRSNVPSRAGWKRKSRCSEAALSRPHDLGSRKRVRSRAFSGRSAHGGAATPSPRRRNHGQVTQLEPGFCHVGLSADVRPRRDKRMLGGGVVFAMGSLAIAAAAVLFGPIGLLPALDWFRWLAGSRVIIERITSGSTSHWNSPRSPGARGDFATRRRYRACTRW